MTCHSEIGEMLPCDKHGPECTLCVRKVEMILYHGYDKCPVCGPNFDPNRVAKKVRDLLASLAIPDDVA